MSAVTSPTASAPLRLYTFAAPSRFYALTGALLPWLWAATALLTAAGLYVGFFVAPTDATQGEAYRIIFIHVPAAWMSMLLYLAMAFWAAIGWAFNARMASILARAIGTSNGTACVRVADLGTFGRARLGTPSGRGFAATAGRLPAARPDRDGALSDRRRASGHISGRGVRAQSSRLRPARVRRAQDPHVAGGIVLVKQLIGGRLEQVEARRIARDSRI